MAKAAALRDVSKPLVAAPTNTLGALIDQAGRIAEERTRLNTVYNKLRTEIEAQMPMVEQGETSEKVGEEFIAKLQFQQGKVVKIKELFKKHPDVFWALVEIPFGAMEDALGADEALKFHNIVFKEAPTLSIKRRKN